MLIVATVRRVLDGGHTLLTPPAAVRLLTVGERLRVRRGAQDLGEREVCALVLRAGAAVLDGAVLEPGDELVRS